MKIKALLVASLAFIGVSAAAMVPASALDIDINLGVSSSGDVQAVTAAALSDLKSVNDVTQAAAMNSLEAVKVDDVNVGALAQGLAQTVIASAALPAGAPATGISKNDITQIAALNNVDLKSIVDGADINVSGVSTSVTQAATAGAVGTQSAMNAVTQLSAVGVVSVNVTP